MAIRVDSLAIPAVKRIETPRHGDDRGFFCETYSHRDFHAAGISTVFLQDNHARSARAGTVRGLHFQVPPHGQAKLVRVIRGAILDVAVDLRQGSPTYGQHVSLTLSAENGCQILIPEGFAHGLVTLEPETEVLYKVSAHYAPDHDRGLLWNDPTLGIDWPVESETAVVSERDKRHPTLAELPVCFPAAAGGTP